MSIIWFLIIGVLAGWIAGELTQDNGFGLIGNLIVGTVGALLGGFLFNLLDIQGYGLTGQLLMSVIGAASFLFILSFFGGVRREIH